MAGDAKKLQPIIIKRVKKGGHAAHGGAWKIAYADFVTAMMAFFLLMWLLGSTTDGDKKGIAEYFGAPLKVAMAGGSGAGDSSSVVKGGGQDLTRTNGNVKRGDIESPKKSINLQALKAEQRKAEAVRLGELKDKVKDVLASNPKLAALNSQIRLDMTEDGLRIQIVDDRNRPMFDSGSAIVKDYMRELLRQIGEVLASVPNRLTLEGHTDAQPFGAGDRGYSNWELSSDRANASRRELVAGGLPEDRVLRVQGLASSNPFDRVDTLAATNRRISIIVMNRDAEDRFAGKVETAEPVAGEQAPVVPVADIARAMAQTMPRRPNRSDRSCLRWPQFRRPRPDNAFRHRIGRSMTTPTDLRFLIVDDFSTMRRIVRGLLKEIGYVNAEEAEDGAIALQTLKKGKFDFVVSDINMPNMNGFDLLAAIKADDELKHLPVLMVTAEARKEDIVRAAKDGAAGYIVKPFTKATLEEKVQKIMQKLATTA